jgi:drug/metabolite transporter (DMT)-like permease
MALQTIRAPQLAFTPGDLALFAATVLVWGTTWLALKYQLGVVDPQVSLVWRFLIAAPLMFLIAWALGARLRYPLRMHLSFAAFGLFGCATNFILFYNAGQFVVSGLLSVIFSLAAMSNIGMAVVFLGDRMRGRVVAGAFLGLAGVALMFSHEIDTSSLGLASLKGLGLGVLGCLSFSFANIVSTRIRREGVPAITINAWGLTYGIAINVAVALVAGSAFIVEPTARYLLALLWLAVPGTVIAFWMYVALLGRVGPDRAGYTTVLSPVLALLVSTIVEDYRWSAVAVAGLVLVAAGNVLVLGRPKPPATDAGSTGSEPKPAL